MIDDLISRQAAIDALGEKPLGDTDWDLGCRNQWEWDTEILKTLPSAQPEQRWIPVTEQLPKLGEKVLVSTKNTVFVQVFKCIYGTPDRWGWEHNNIKKVIAWMPLPEPYKERSK